MNEFLLPIAAVVFLIFAGLLTRQWRELKRLQHSQKLLEDQVRRNHEDIAGLCSAAVEVDQYLARNQAHINALTEYINDLQYQQPEPEPQPQAIPSKPNQNDQLLQGYDKAIQKIRGGLGVDDLVKECGLTRDEAVLLMRLHGGK
jgi:uncharacterized coiled-coil protein SlyX